jgi:hypothetical protein
MGELRQGGQACWSDGHHHRVKGQRARHSLHGRCLPACLPWHIRPIPPSTHTFLPATRPWPDNTAPAVGTISTYNASTGVNYILNTGKMSFSQAEQYCRDNGGHLAAWNSLAEQVSCCCCCCSC